MRLLVKNSGENLRAQPILEDGILPSTLMPLGFTSVVSKHAIISWFRWQNYESSKKIIKCYTAHQASNEKKNIYLQNVTQTF